MKALSSRALVRASIVLASAVAASAAHADHKLFPTDVLTSGEVDASVGLSRVETKQDDAPHVKATTKAGGLTGRVGVGERTHLSFSLARADVDVTSDVTSRASSNATGYGIGVRHALITEGPVTLSIDGGLTHAKASGANASTSWDASLRMGFKAPRDIRPYVMLGVQVPDEDEGGETWSLQGGAWIPVHQRVTVIPFVNLSRSQESHSTPTASAVDLGASALVQLNERAYVMPTLSFGKGKVDDEKGKRTTAAISLYYKY